VIILYALGAIGSRDQALCLCPTDSGGRTRIWKTSGVRLRQDRVHNGPDHAVKIEFCGKEAQPDLRASAYWSCTRNSVSTFNDQAFTCKQTGGM